MATKISEMSTLTGSSTNNNSFLPIVDELVSSNVDKNKKVRISTHNQFYSNNFTTINQSSYKNYFGTGVDGDVTLSSSAQISSSFNNSLDGDFVVKNYKSLTINSGVTLLPLKRCRGLIIYCTGDLTVNGSISMTSKGGGVGSRTAPFAKTTETNFLAIDGTMYFNNFSSSADGIPSHWNFATSGSHWWPFYKIKVPMSGSVAGGAASSILGNNGAAGVFTCGGGGSGGGNSSGGNGGGGGRGTIFVGGGGGGGASGGGAGQAALFETGGKASSTFDEGTGGYGYGGGGAGNPIGSSGGTVSSPVSPVASTGVGGLIIFIVKGTITINSGATITSNGANGGAGAGNGSPNPTFHRGSGGGGSGGGMIVCVYGNSFSNAGSITVSGGNGGAAGPSGGSTSYGGGAGGAGTITIRKVHA